MDKNPKIEKSKTNRGEEQIIINKILKYIFKIKYC